MTLTEKQQKHQHYHQVKLININILQVKEYYLLIKLELQIKLIYLFYYWKNFEKLAKTIEDQGRKQIDDLKVLKSDTQQLPIKDVIP